MRGGTPESADGSDTPLFNTAAVVQRTGVPAVTFRAWERRYDYPKPRRNSGGQRLYSERDIQAIRWLSEQTGQGVAISRAVEMLRLGYAHPNPPRSERSEGGRTFEALQAELGDALLAVARDRAEAVLAEAFALFPVEDVCLQVLQPMLIDIGERWHAGDVSVAEEHYASSFVRGKVFGLLHAYQIPDGAGPLVFTACAPDEWHELGALVVSVFLARRGAAVRYLGPNLPLDALGAIATRHLPAAVVLSAQSAETARNLRPAAGLLDGLAPMPLLFFGGQAFNVDSRLRFRTPGTYVGPDAGAAAATIIQQIAQAQSAGGRDRRRTSASTAPSVTRRRRRSAAE
jgi:DNA-binding transcriptional MerR regulator